MRVVCVPVRSFSRLRGQTPSGQFRIRHPQQKATTTFYRLPRNTIIQHVPLIHTEISTTEPTLRAAFRLRIDRRRRLQLDRHEAHRDLLDVLARGLDRCCDALLENGKRHRAHLGPHARGEVNE